MAITKTDLHKRMLGKFLVGDECWDWTASRSNTGYGQISNSGGRGTSPLKAHRVMYEWLVGPIPAGMDLDHLCRNRGCVNPTHLEPVTRAENVRRGHIGPCPNCGHTWAKQRRGSV